MCTKTLVKTGCIILLSALFSFSSYAQPKANFSSNTISGCAPLVVNFSDNSTGNPISWKWDLGNGTVSFLQNPSVAYFDPGQYTVKLVVRNAAGSDSIIKINNITVYAKPTINFSVSSQSGCTPLSVNFTDLSTPGDGSIQSWQWDFGDGTFSEEKNPNHIYSTVGNFNVSLLAVNSYGCVASVTKKGLIKLLENPAVSFINSPVTNCGTPQLINFQNTTTGSGTLKYRWDFGDGIISTAINPSHTYTKAGTFTIKLYASNENGCADSSIKANAFTIQNINTGFKIPDTICVNAPVSIVNLTAPAATNSSWSFGDSTNSIEITPNKTYTKAGVYEIKLLNNFDGCKDSITKKITVIEAALPDFSATPLSSCQAPLVVNFTNNSSNAASYTWSFGDNTSSNNTNPVKTYTKQGNYTVSLTATSAGGCINTITKSQYVSIQFPEASIQNLPTKGCAPLDFTFTPSVIGGDSIVSYNWNFGDSTTSDLANPTHTFQAGVYDISLVIVTASGCTDTVVYKGGIKAGVKPQVGFSADPREVCARIPVIFKNLTTPATGIYSADSFKWEFGDGGTSTLKDPQYVYQDTGKFTVQLIAENNGCADTLKIKDYVRINPPIAKFKTDPDCKNRATRVFTDQSIGADTWLWSFGDGKTSTEKSPVHVYSKSGTYKVELTVTNLKTGCDFTATQEITINVEKINFKASETEICRDNYTTFSTIGNTSYLSSYSWSFGDGGTGSTNPERKIYYFPGKYTVGLITTDKNNCKDTIRKVNYITVNGPTAKFEPNAKTSCALTSVSFIDKSVSDGRNAISKYIWNYGDGKIDTLASGPFSHFYNAGGSFNVQLTAVDVKGCLHTVSSTSALSILQPIAKFNSTDTLNCPNKTVSFTNLSIGGVLSYLWNFGDGNTSTLANPTHTYSAEGTYSVKLTVFNSTGCSDSITKVNYMKIQYPGAAFNVSDSVGTCPPLIVKFTNTSTFYTSINWDFGDGTNATTENPSHFYSIAGTYIAKLTVVGPGGCVSVAQKKILVKGPSGSFTYGGLSGCAPYTINLKATTKGTNSYVWDYNDGNAIASSSLNTSHTYTLKGFYIPKLILKDTAGCIVPIIGKDTVRVYDVAAGLNFDAPTVCDAGTVNFNSSVTSNDIIKTYSWNFGDDSTSALQNPSHYFNKKGVFYPKLIVTTEKGCKDTVLSKNPIKVASSPIGAITQTANGCVDLTVKFTAKLTIADTAAMTWKWNFGNENSSNTNNPDPQTYRTAGDYKVNLFITSSLGCKDTVTTTVEAYAIPNINAGIDTAVCKGRGKTLAASGGSTYTWVPSTGLSCTNCANPVANPDSAITYVVTGKSIHGCVNKDTINVTVKYPFSMRPINGDTLCKGESMRLSASGAYRYNWTPSEGLDNPNSASPMATPMQTTTYRVVGTDDKDCFTDTIYIPMVVYAIPTVDAGLDKSINVGQTVEITPKVSADVIDAKWSPSGQAFRSNFPNLTVKPRETTTYRVDVVNQGGCASFDEITINVLCDGANIFIPNTFSPNADGMNDIFYPRGTGLFNIKRLKIFTRWGELVFEQNNFMANDATKGWDGTFKGNKLNPDVFVYVTEVVCDNNSVLTFKGNVALIR